MAERAAFALTAEKRGVMSVPTHPISAVRLLACVFVFALAACSGGGGGGTPAPTPTPTAPPANLIVPPAGTIYLGAYVNTSGAPVALISDLTSFEAQVGRKMVLTEHYYGFYSSFPTAAETEDLSEGRVPIESWGCQPSNAQIAAGSADAAILARAQALRAFGKPIFLRYEWEMNVPTTATYRSACYDPATDEPNGVLSPVEFIAAWQHIHTIFATAGANNVIFLWNPAGATNGTPYYPGDAVVDWVGFDRYDTLGNTFEQTYVLPYAQLSLLGKPMMIAETGAFAPYQSTFFAAAAATLQSSFPQVRAWVYFDANGTNKDWEITGSGLQAFATMGAQPYFAAQPPL
jgi:hypothetical protein